LSVLKKYRQSSEQSFFGRFLTRGTDDPLKKIPTQTPMRLNTRKIKYMSFIIWSTQKW